jgi:hypothetical protein
LSKRDNRRIIRQIDFRCFDLGKSSAHFASEIRELVINKTRLRWSLKHLNSSLSFCEKHAVSAEFMNGTSAKVHAQHQSIKNNKLRLS